MHSGKGGVKRSLTAGARGIPLGSMTGPANHHDSPLLVAILDAARALGLVPKGATVHLDRVYDSKLSRLRLLERGLVAEVFQKGRPAPLNATKRWAIEHTDSLHNAHRKLLWCTERRGRVVWTSGSPCLMWSSS